jgi:hypothetical protein
MTLRLHHNLYCVAGLGADGRLLAFLNGLALILCVGTLFDAPSAAAQETTDRRLEYNVKAASIYAFARYVTWPESAFDNEKSPFVIGVLGSNPFGEALNRIAEKKTLDEHKIQVRQLSSPKEYSQCHIVFVTGSVEPAVETELFRLAAGKPVLLVGESPGFVERGGIINFYQSGNNVRFELNADKGAQSRLSLNAKLLSLGKKASATR